MEKNRTRIDNKEKIEKIIKYGKSLVTPEKKEKKELKEIKANIKEMIQKELNKLNFQDVKILIEGSVGKGTWLPEDKDIDIFLAFPQYYKTKEMMEKGKKIGKKIGKKSNSYKISYAQHPYVQIKYKGHKAEIVPSHQVESYEDVKTAVDRTPLHTKYINEKTSNSELKTEIRLLKKFMKSIEVYGSEKSMKGFSGYVSELLVIKYGSFLKVLKHARNWGPNELIDLKDWLNSKNKESERAKETIERDKEKPMILLDPVDPRRNAAAILSWEKMAEFSIAAEKFFETPRKEFFTEIPVKKQSKNLKELLEEKDTDILIISFKSPDLIKDTLIPQLEKTEKSLRSNLEKKGFKIYDSTSGKSNELCYIFFELERKDRSKTQIRNGPPFHMKERKEFIEEYEKVWVENKRLKAEYRVESNVLNLTKSLLRTNRVGIGKNIKKQVNESNLSLNNVSDKKLEKKAIKFLNKSKKNLNRFIEHSP